MKSLPSESSPCSRCQILPDPLVDRGTLYLHTPQERLRGVLADYLRSMGATPDEPTAGILGVPVTAPRLREWAQGFAAILTTLELQETRSLLLGEGVVPSLANLMTMQPLSALVATIQGEWLLEVLRRDRLEVHFQPIIHAARPTEVFAYECLLRGRDAQAQLIGPDRLFGAARSADLLMNLDRQARLSAIRSSMRFGITSHVFINFNPSSIYNPTSCLRSTVQAVQEVGATPDRFVFEVVESEEVRDSDRLLKILDFYRSEGFQVALDDVGAGYSSLNLLTRLKPDFIKLDMQLVRGVDRDMYKAQVAAKLLEMAQALDIRTVVEGVETAAEWSWAVEHGADYAQGYLFARPACPPPGLTFPALPGLTP